MSPLTGLIFTLLAFAVVIILLALSQQPKREYGIKSITAKGEEVRSQAERRIADYFAEHNIKYSYEQKAKAMYANPDFYLPDYNVYVEYWGLVDADDPATRERYVRSMKRKMAIYHQNNLKFISIYPSNLENLDWIFRTKFKKVTGFELPA
jgi:hypothetical protein